MLERLNAGRGERAPRLLLPLISVAVVLLRGGVSANAQAQPPVPTPTPPANPTSPAQPPTPPEPVVPPIRATRPASARPVDPPVRIPRPQRGVRPIMPPSTANRRPNLFDPLPFYEKRNNFFFDGAADVRYRTVSASGEKETVGTYVSSVRMTTDIIRANPDTGDERGGARFQLLLESDNRGTRLDRLRVSEGYVFYRFLFPGVSANLRAGQFVLPFGLLAVYDTPLQPIQPLYEKSLGLRVDTGTMLEGDYDVYHYAIALTRGVGPNKSDEDRSGVVTFRLSRNVRLPNFKGKSLGRAQVGGSLLAGRLPVTGFSTELPPSGFSGARGQQQYVKKSRFAWDGVGEVRPFRAMETATIEGVY